MEAQPAAKRSKLFPHKTTVSAIPRWYTGRGNASHQLVPDPVNGWATWEDMALALQMKVPKNKGSLDVNHTTTAWRNIATGMSEDEKTRREAV